jgi:SGNH domain (fused to AT3 domains)
MPYPPDRSERRNHDPKGRSSGSFRRCPLFASGLWEPRAIEARIDQGCQLADGAAFSEFDVEQCIETENPEKILVIGDSYAPEAFVALSEMIPEERFVVAGGAGCLPLYPVPSWQSRISGAGCAELNERRFQWAEREDVTAIVLTTNWSLWEADQIQSTLARLYELDKPVIILGVRPIYSQPVPFVLDSVVGSATADRLNDYLNQDFDAVRGQLEQVIASFPDNFLYVDTFRILCSPDCSAFTAENRLMYLDASHASLEGARSIGRQINQLYGDRVSEYVSSYSQVSSREAAGPINLAWGSIRDEQILVPENVSYHVELQGSEQVGVISAVPEEASSANETDGVAFRVPYLHEQNFSGQLIVVTVEARSSDDSAGIGIAYSTNEVGNSGWNRFELAPNWAEYSFTYFVPELIQGRGDFLGLRSYENSRVEIRRIEIRRNR